MTVNRRMFVTLFSGASTTIAMPARMGAVSNAIEPLNAVTNWPASSGCSRAANTSEFVEGGASLKVTSAVGSVGDVRYTAALNLSAAQSLSMWIYIHNAVSDLAG